MTKAGEGLDLEKIAWEAADNIRIYVDNYDRDSPEGRLIYRNVVRALERAVEAARQALPLMHYETTGGVWQWVIQALTSGFTAYGKTAEEAVDALVSKVDEAARQEALEKACAAVCAFCAEGEKPSPTPGRYGQHTSKTGLKYYCYGDKVRRAFAEEERG